MKIAEINTKAPPMMLVKYTSIPKITSIPKLIPI